MSISRLHDWLALRHQRRLRTAAAIVPAPSSARARRGRLARVFALWVVVVLMGGFFDASDSWGYGFGFGWFEGYIYNAASTVRARWGESEHGSEFVIVPLSDDTFSTSNFSALPGPPVPRNYHAQLIRFLTQAKAKIIAFDLVFDAVRAEDKELAAATKAAGKAGTQVLWACIVDESNGLLLPNEQLRAASGNIAHVLVERNAARPVVERVPAFIVGETDDDRIPAMSLKIAMMIKGIPEQKPRRVANAWQIGGMRIPIEKDGTFFISYGGSPQGGFPYVPYENLIAPGEETAFYQKLLKDKIVLIGDTTKLGNDWKDTPLGNIPGVEVHAHAASTLLRSEFLHPAPIWVNLLFVALLPALLALFHDARHTRTLILAIFALGLGYVLLVLWLFVAQNYSIHMVGPLVAFSLFSTGVLLNRGLREERERQRMFDALVLAASSAIESRDPSTAGHSRRVTSMTTELAIAVSASRVGKYRRVRFSAIQIKELCYAALLHDFGKIGVREAILTKSHKLEPLHFQVVKGRLLFLKSARQTDYLQQKIDLLESGLLAEELPSRVAELEAKHDEDQRDLEHSLNSLARANDPEVTWMSDDEYAHLQSTLDELEGQNYCDEKGVLQPLITPEEKAALSIRKGSLTQDEYQQIQNHAQLSYDFLKQIHWTRDLENLAFIAWGHHEKLSGGGYPRGVKAEDIPLTTRMMTIADIFDALTASDRPYKRALPLERALSILQSEAKEGGIDSDLLEVFIESRVHESIYDDRSAWLFPNR